MTNIEKDSVQNIETAKLFHDTYERLAPDFGYETREDTKAFDPFSPNGRLMIEVCRLVSDNLLQTEQTRIAEEVEKSREKHENVTLDDGEVHVLTLPLEQRCFNDALDKVLSIIKQGK